MSSQSGSRTEPRQHVSVTLHDVTLMLLIGVAFGAVITFAITYRFVGEARNDKSTQDRVVQAKTMPRFDENQLQVYGSGKLAERELRGWHLLVQSEYLPTYTTANHAWPANKQLANNEQRLTDSANFSLEVLATLIKGYAARLGATTEANGVDPYTDHLIVLHLSASVDCIAGSTHGVGSPVTLWVRAEAGYPTLLPNSLADVTILTPPEVGEESWLVVQACRSYVSSYQQHRLLADAIARQPTK